MAAVRRFAPCLLPAVPGLCAASASHAGFVGAYARPSVSVSGVPDPVRRTSSA